MSSVASAKPSRRNGRSRRLNAVTPPRGCGCERRADHPGRRFRVAVRRTKQRIRARPGVLGGLPVLRRNRPPQRDERPCLPHRGGLNTRMLSDQVKRARDQYDQKLRIVARFKPDITPPEIQPVGNVIWVDREFLQANSWNPNFVSPPELKLLKVSILSDGWT